MADTPSVLGRRYLPFLAVVAVQVLLAAVVPSRGTTAGSTFTGNTGVGGNSATGFTPTDNGGNATTNGTTAAGPNGTRSAVGGSSAVTGSTGVGTDTSGTSGFDTGGAVPGATGPVDRSDCDRNGKQVGPPGYAYMPPCVPVWHGGDNGGATMPGVTGTAINFVLYRVQANAEVNAILGEQGLAATTTQQCASQMAFLKDINRFWNTYGRHFVSLDGPGANAGSSQQGCSGAPYFQSTCPLTPPNPSCDAAEAKVVAAMHPAVVIGNPNIFFTQELVAHKIPLFGGGENPESYYDTFAPYFYGILMDGQRQAHFDSEYWCKKLNAQAANFAGPDVKTTRGWGNPPTAVPVRKIAVLYPVNNGDTTFRISVDQFKQDLTGKVCNTPGGVLEINYASDITTAQQQSDTIVQELIQNKITTVACWCDPIAPVFLTTAMVAQNYFPEHYILGVGLIDYDVLGRLYQPTEWSHAFGVSDLFKPKPLPQSDATHWYQAGGQTGQPDATENATVPFYSFMATAFQMAGPKPTVLGLASGLENLPLLGGWARTHDPSLAQVGFRSPSLWTALEDTREVYWNQNRTSEVDGKSGSYCPVNGGQRYLPGEWTGGSSEIFNSAKNGC